VLPGAFDVSIKKKGFSGPAGVKLLAHHDSEKNLGVIRKLETVDNNLRIEAELALKSSYVRDLYEVTKLNGGLSFSVGFRLEDYEFVEENKEEVFLIKQGELMEVSVVNFPACPDARMDFIKRVDTPSEFEKALMASDLAVTRNEAHKLMQLCKIDMKGDDAVKRQASIRTLRFMKEQGVLLSLRDAPGETGKPWDDLGRGEAVVVGDGAGEDGEEAVTLSLVRGQVSGVARDHGAVWIEPIAEAPGDVRGDSRRDGASSSG
jgi:HK97 family phage prohead protease